MKTICFLFFFLQIFDLKPQNILNANISSIIIKWYFFKKEINIIIEIFYLTFILTRKN